MNLEKKPFAISFQKMHILLKCGAIHAHKMSPAVLCITFILEIPIFYL